MTMEQRETSKLSLDFEEGWSCREELDGKESLARVDEEVLRLG